jgi:hypothetical protein
VKGIDVDAQGTTYIFYSSGFLYKFLSSGSPDTSFGKNGNGGLDVFAAVASSGTAACFISSVKVFQEYIFIAVSRRYSLSLSILPNCEFSNGMEL